MNVLVSMMNVEFVMVMVLQMAHVIAQAIQRIVLEFVVVQQNLMNAVFVMVMVLQMVHVTVMVM